MSERRLSPPERRKAVAREPVLAEEPLGGLQEVSSRQIERACVPGGEFRIEFGVGVMLQGDFDIILLRDARRPHGQRNRAKHASAAHRDHLFNRGGGSRSQCSCNAQFGRPQIDRRADQYEFGDLARKSTGVNCGEPAALAQAHEGGAPAEIVNSHVEIAQIGVDIVVAHFGGGRLPIGHGDDVHARLHENGRETVAGCEVSDQAIVERIGRNDQQRSSADLRRLASLEEPHRWQFDPHSTEDR